MTAPFWKTYFCKCLIRHEEPPISEVDCHRQDALWSVPQAFAVPLVAPCALALTRTAFALPSSLEDVKPTGS
jgi:hypothetical protein